MTRADRIGAGRIKIPNTIATMTPSRPWHRNTTARLRGFKPPWVIAMNAMESWNNEVLEYWIW